MEIAKHLSHLVVIDSVRQAGEVTAESLCLSLADQAEVDPVGEEDLQDHSQEDQVEELWKDPVVVVEDVDYCHCHQDNLG